MIKLITESKIKVNCLTFHITQAERKVMDKRVKKGGLMELGGHFNAYFILLCYQYDLDSSAIGFDTEHKDDLLIFKIYYI